MMPVVVPLLCCCCCRRRCWCCDLDTSAGAGVSSSAAIVCSAALGVLGVLGHACSKQVARWESTAQREGCPDILTN